MNKAPTSTPKPVCEHEWVEVKEHIVADNPVHDHERTFYFVKRKCTKCPEVRLIDYRTQ